MPKMFIFELRLLHTDLTVQSRQRLRVTLGSGPGICAEKEWPSIQKKLQEFCEKRGWCNCKVQYLNGNALRQLANPSNLKSYLELHSEALVGDTATLPLYLVPDPTDGPSSSAISGEEIVLEVDQGSPIVLTLQSDILLGEGGFGQVRRTRDRETGAACAMKSSHQSELSQRNMKREINTLLQLNHPNIIKILQHGYVVDAVHGHLPAYMMDLGRCSVQALFETGWHNKAAAEAAQRDVTSALQHFHAAGLVHMDVKPGNWLVTNKFTTPNGEVDFELMLIDAGAAGQLKMSSVRSCTKEFMPPGYESGVSGQMMYAFHDWYALRKGIFLLSTTDSDRELNTHPQLLERASETLAGDRGLLLDTVREDGLALEFASEELQNDKEVVMEAVREDGRALEFVGEELQSDKEVVLEAVRQTGSALEFAGESLRSDNEVVIAAVRQDGSALEFACEKPRSDKEVVVEAVRQEGIALEFASKTLKSNKEVVMEAVKQDGSALEFACKTLQGDKDVVMQAVLEDGSALEFACKKLRSDKEVIMDMVRHDSSALEFACKTLRADKEVVMEAIRQDGSALEFACKTLRADKEVVMEAIRQDGSALEFACKTLQGDKDIVMQAVLEDGSALEFACKKLRSDKEVVMEAVKQDGSALEFASKTLQAEKEVVMEAIGQDGSALEFACKTLRADKEVVMEAVKQDGSALEFASKMLQADKEVVMEAVTQCGSALEFASKMLQSDKEVVAQGDQAG
eukprot:s278_g26.t1